MGRLLLLYTTTPPVHDGYAFLIGVYALYPILFALCHMHSTSLKSKVRRVALLRKMKKRPRKIKPLSAQFLHFARRAVSFSFLLGRIAVEFGIVLPLLAGACTRMSSSEQFNDGG